MDNQSKMTNSASKRCGKMLSCLHRCQQDVEADHTCICTIKRPFVRECAQPNTENRSEAKKPKSAETCAQILNCGHPCLEPSGNGNFTCICHICFDKTSLKTDQPQIPITNPDKNRSPILKLKSTKHGTSRLTFLTKKPKNKSTVPVPGQQQTRSIENLGIQLKIFVQCVNEHIFTSPENMYCPECGCPPFGPRVILLQNPDSQETINPVPIPTPTPVLEPIPVPVQISAAPETPLILNDDNAWKFGYAKCSNGHYFIARLPGCHVCGESSLFFYRGSDSDSSN